MPKLKTNKSVAKRYRVTKRGKILRHRAGKSHLLSGKSSKRRRHLRKCVVVKDVDVRKLKRLLGLMG